MEYRILVVDDEPEIRSLLHEWLEERVQKALPGKYIVYEAGDGNEAMGRIGECQAKLHSLDLAIVDLMMPGKSGFQVIDDLLQVSPLTKVVVLSATAAFHAEELQRRYGTDLTMLTKPILRVAFIDTVKRILSEGNYYA